MIYRGKKEEKSGRRQDVYTLPYLLGQLRQNQSSCPRSYWQLVSRAAPRNEDLVPNTIHYYYNILLSRTDANRDGAFRWHTSSGH